MKKQILVFSTLFAMAVMSFASTGVMPVSAAQEDFTTAASFSPTSPNVGEATTVTVDFTNNGPDLTGFVVDLEIYSTEGPRVFQAFTEVEGRTLSSGATGHLDYEWTPAAPGTYVAKVGLFGTSWSSLLHWNNEAGTVEVSGAGGGGDVTLAGGEVITPEDPTTLSALFETDDPPSMEVLLDLELYRDSTGEKVAQEFWNNVVIPDTDPFERQLAVPDGLTEGDYTFKAGIFNPDWAGLLSWHNMVAQFTIGEGPPPAEGASLTRSGARPAEIDAGEISNLCGQFTSTGGPDTVLIDLELYNSTGTKVQQEFFDGVVIPEGGAEAYCMESATDLPAGEYFFRIGIFEPAWAGLINWYNDAGMLTIN